MEASLQPQAGLTNRPLVRDFQASAPLQKLTNLLTHLLRLIGIFWESKNHRNRQEMNRSFNWYEAISKNRRFVRKNVQNFGVPKNNPKKVIFG